jgi:hypothetical protein
MVLHLSDTKKTRVTGQETIDYFFEDLDNEQFYPMGQKLKSLNYDEDSRNELR